CICAQKIAPGIDDSIAHRDRLHIGTDAPAEGGPVRAVPRGDTRGGEAADSIKFAPDIEVRSISRQTVDLSPHPAANFLPVRTVPASDVAREGTARISKIPSGVKLVLKHAHRPDGNPRTRIVDAEPRAHGGPIVPVPTGYVRRGHTAQVRETSANNERAVMHGH